MALSKQGVRKACRRPKLCKLHLIFWLYECGANQDYRPAFQCEGPCYFTG